MAARIIINSSGARYGQARKYAELSEAVAGLEPDGALFVTAAEMPADGEGRREQVLALRSGICGRFRERGIVVIEDLDRGGVWVYRPAAWGPGNGRAIGPEKEAEIRRRRIEGTGRQA